MTIFGIEAPQKNAVILMHVLASTVGSHRDATGKHCRETEKTYDTELFVSTITRKRISFLSTTVDSGCVVLVFVVRCYLLMQQTKPR